MFPVHFISFLILLCVLDSLFHAAYEHVCRIARILRQPRGNALLVGVGGSGKRTLTLLASFILDMRTYQIAMKKGYDIRAFRDDLKNVYIRTGVEGQKLVFILNDSQITSESMVEDVNNMLNSVLSFFSAFLSFLITIFFFFFVVVDLS